MSERLCRNVIIHGWCKYEKTGCKFHHPSADNQNVTEAKGLRINAPEFKPTSSTIPSETAENLPVLDLLSPEYPKVFSPTRIDHMPQFTYGFQDGLLMPLQHHLYTPFAGNKESGNTSGSQSNSHLFITESLRQRLVERNEELCRTSVSEEQRHHVVQVHSYHSLVLLNDQTFRDSKFTKCNVKTYRATSVDGKACMLRRIENYSLVNESLIAAFEVHSRISNPYIVQLKEVFTTKHFHDDSVVFVYEYEANFVPLGQLPWKQLFFREDDIWFLVCQLVSALKSVHEKGLSFRGLNFDNILYSGDRVKLDYFGMFDLINPLQSSLLVAFQDDLMSFGKLMLDMISANNPKFKITDQSTTNYSSDFLNLVRYLLSPPSPSKTIDDLIFKLGHRLLVAMNRCARTIESHENEMSKELENGRLFRLACQLGFINERPEFDMDPNWAETGDRYVLKLFRDYVFHQVDSEGNPVLDIGHVVKALNKVDVGVQERVLLTSRDEKSCLIVTYEDLKRCIILSLQDLRNRKQKT